MEKSSLQISDELAQSVQKTPNRVTLQSIEDKISAQYILNAETAVDACGCPAVDSLKVLTICILVMKNGFTVIGKSAPADAVNYDKELGEKFAKEDAIRQLWPLEGYALREKLNSE